MRWIYSLVLVAACFAVYSNGYEHAYNLDSSHVIENNPAVRSVDVVGFFTDARKSTSLYSNVDYRPMLSLANALNYRIAEGQVGGPLAMPRWHFVQILLHGVCVLGLFALGLVVLRWAGDGDPPRGAVHIAFAAALVFALHPTESGVVNYLSARSSLLTAAFLLPAWLLYMRAPEHGARGLGGWLAVLLFGCALFTKVEGLAGLAPLFLVDVWRTARRGAHSRGFFGDLGRTLDGPWLRRFWPYAAFALVYLVARHAAMRSFDYAEASGGVNLSRWAYLLTQTTAWWTYVAKWFAPFGLVADDARYPIYESLLDARVLVALGGWLLVTSFAVAQWRRRPYLAVLSCSALALLSPSSSIFVLSEMVNEHRPYLPLAVLSLCWMLPAGAGLVRHASPPAVKLVSLFALALVLAGFAHATYERNQVFRTHDTYWRDVVEKAPASRSLNNYGLTLQRDGRHEEALKYFARSVEFAPFWHISHINIAVSHAALGHAQEAQEHYDRAVEYDVFSGTALTYRAEHSLRQARFDLALKDFDAAEAKSLELYRLAKGRATAYAGLGDAQHAYEWALRCAELEPARFDVDIKSIAGPFWIPGHAEAGVACFEQLRRSLPENPWVHENLARLADLVGRPDLAAEARAAVERLRTTGQD